MADLSDLNSAQSVKLVGANSSGVETNYIDATADGLKVDGSAVTQPISAASLPLPTGAATETTQATGNTRLGDLTETAPGTDTSSSGLNGRLQRIAQRLTSLITATTDKTQWTKLTDGTNDAIVKAASTPVAVSDPALVTSDSPYNYNYIKATATTVVKSGAGVLHTISVVTGGNGTATVYDNTAGSGTIIALITSTNGTPPSVMIFDVEFTTGLTIVTSSNNPAFTVSYK